jgi:hypothetical protein
MERLINGNREIYEEVVCGGCSNGGAGNLGAGSSGDLGFCWSVAMSDQANAASANKKIRKNNKNIVNATNRPA